MVHAAVAQVQPPQRRAASFVQVSDEPSVQTRDVGDAQSGESFGEHPDDELVGAPHRLRTHAVQAQLRQSLAEWLHRAQR